MNRITNFFAKPVIIAIFVALGTIVSYGQTQTVLTLDCATPAPTGSTSTALSNTSDIATFLNSAAGLSSKITCSAKSGDVYKGKGSGGGEIPQQCLKVGKASGGGSFTFTIPNTYDLIDEIDITCYGWKTTSSISINSGTAQTFTTAQSETTKTFNLASSSRTITVAVTSSAVCITSIVLKKAGVSTCASPTFSPVEGAYASAQNVTISTATEGATIYYTLDGTTPTESSDVYTSAISVSSTQTIKAIAAKAGCNNSPVASATYTIMEPLTTMDAIFASATSAASTASPVVVTFSDWVVSAVNNDKAYVTDGTKGFIIYQSGHGFVVGDILSGTVSCKVQLYHGSSEITTLTSSTPGLTVSKGGVVTPVTSASISSLNGVNTGAVYCFNNLDYDGTNLSDGESIIKPYQTLSSYTLVNGKSYNVTGVYLQYDSTKEILPRSNADVEEIVIASPIIYTSVNSLSGFTYDQGNGPSDAKSFTVSGSNLTASISLTMGGDDYEMSLTADSDYAASLALSPTAGEVANTTVYVRLKAGKLQGSYSGSSITLSSTGADNKTVSLSGTVTEPEAAHVKWNLGAASYASADEDLVSWSSSYATMKLEKNTSSTSANNYLGGTNDHTRFYKDQLLSIAPTSGYAISSVVITAVTGYATGFTGNDWTNASKSSEENIVTITPTDGRNAVSVAISAACRATVVKVYYVVDVTPSIEVSSTSIEATSAETAGSLTVTYNHIETGLGASIYWYTDGTGTSSTTEPDWIDAEINGSTLNVDYIIAANTGSARSAYFKVYGLDAGANDVYSELVTISQAAYVAPPSGDQFKPFSGSLVEGDYVIVYDDDAMNTTVSSDRLQYMDVTLSNGNVYTDDASIVWHIAPSGDYWTIYNSEAYAYAASTGAKNKAQMLEDGADDKSLWDVTGTVTYEFQNKANAAASVNSLLRKNGNYGFACYADATGGALSLYKYDGEASINISASSAAGSDGLYYATFFNSAARYTLPEGAQAFTMNSSKQLYRLGTDGSVIPMNTAVIIISKSADITLTRSSETSAIAVNGGANILKGSNYEIAKPGSGTTYVLGIVGGNLGFYEYTGSNIPANKAYYVVE